MKILDILKNFEILNKILKNSEIVKSFEIVKLIVILQNSENLKNFEILKIWPGSHLGFLPRNPSWVFAAGILLSIILENVIFVHFG